MQTGSLVGRDAELDQVEARTRSNRLVTIVGPGGVGKTTLAPGTRGPGRILVPSRGG